MIIPNALIWVLIFILPIAFVIGIYCIIRSLKRKKYRNWSDDEHVLKSVLALSTIPVFVGILFLFIAFPTIIVISDNDTYHKYRVIGSYEGLKYDFKKTYVFNKSTVPCVYLSCFYGKPYKYSLFSKSDKIVQIAPNECILAEDGVKEVFKLPPHSVVYKSRSGNFPEDHYIGFVLNVSLYQEYLAR